MHVVLEKRKKKCSLAARRVSRWRRSFLPSALVDGTTTSRRRFPGWNTDFSVSMHTFWSVSAHIPLVNYCSSDARKKENILKSQIQSREVRGNLIVITLVSKKQKFQKQLPFRIRNFFGPYLCVTIRHITQLGNSPTFCRFLMKRIFLGACSINSYLDHCSITHSDSRAGADFFPFSLLSNVLQDIDTNFF